MHKMVQKCSFIAWERHQFCRSVCVLLMSGGVGLCSNRQTESQRVSGSGSDELFRCVLCLSDTSITTRGGGGEGDRVHRAQRSGPRSPGHREHRDIPFEEWADRRNEGELPDIRHCFYITAHGKPHKANTPKARTSAPRCIRQPCVKAERDQSPTGWI